MKNLEAAQVQMEQKLKTMTGFIEKELEKEKNNPVSRFVFFKLMNNFFS